LTEPGPGSSSANSTRRFVAAAAIAVQFLNWSCVPSDLQSSAPERTQVTFSNPVIVINDRWSDANSDDLAAVRIGQMKAGVSYDVVSIDYAVIAQKGVAHTADRNAVTAALQLTSVTEENICAKKKHDAALLYIHGYDVDFSGALTNADSVAQKYGDGRDVFLWSWPSHGHVSPATLGDAAFWARGSGRRLYKFMAEILRCYRPGAVSVLAHSMGAEVVMGMLSRDEETPLLPAQSDALENLILASPYSGRGEFEHRQRQIERLFRKTTISQVANDGVLALGSAANPFLDPLGLYDASIPVSNMFNAHQIDVVVAASFGGQGLDQDLIRHQAYLHDEIVIKDIYAVLHAETLSRCLVPVHEDYADEEIVGEYYGIGQSCDCWPKGIGNRDRRSPRCPSDGTTPCETF
jgi:esterase/lipase superfamily enzyme